VATLVLSTVGTVLGGPIGGAIGALIGQSIDQQLLAPATRGPRLGDLSVQSSSYGTQVPRVYGTMRVAGSVVWATDLVQSATTTGAKGQPDTTFSYSVSFAVALSSRSVAAIKRIWADGKLLRGEEGDFKVSTTFRFYTGSEDQLVDPLIASIEGLDNTPAYRGLALAVFENLELADYGNRIPFLTFEVVADEAPPAIATILSDASAGAIIGDAPQPLMGYAAYGQSVKTAVEPLVASFGIELFDDGLQVRGPLSSTAQFVADSEWGNSADNQQVAKLQREQTSARALPDALRLGYYDPARDYQSGEARASASEQAGREEQNELAAVLDAADAKSLVEQILARTWASRDKLTLRLPPTHLALEPGMKLELPLTPSRWTIQQCTLDAFVVVAELRPDWNPIAAVSGAAGRIVQNNDVVQGAVQVALLDVPDVLGQSSDAPTLLLAASSSTPGWKSTSVTIRAGDQSFAVPVPRRKTVLGRAVTQLAAGQAFLIDTLGTVDVELIDPDQWLVSCDDDALAEGVNLAVLGSELIQYGVAQPLGSGRFRLQRLLRGRAGTEWANANHSSGESFVLLEPDALRSIRLPLWASGATIAASATGVPAGTPGESAVVLSCESLRPLAPANLDATLELDGGLTASWIRRTRKGGWWIDEVDAALGEASEIYRVTIEGSGGSFECQCGAAELAIAADNLSTLGPGPATVQVRQVGDWAASRPAEFNLTLP
jgi:hypothetical protein